MVTGGARILSSLVTWGHPLTPTPHMAGEWRWRCTDGVRSKQAKQATVLYHMLIKIKLPLTHSYPCRFFVQRFTLLFVIPFIILDIIHFTFVQDIFYSSWIRSYPPLVVPCAVHCRQLMRWHQGAECQVLSISSDQDPQSGTTITFPPTIAILVLIFNNFI